MPRIVVARVDTVGVDTRWVGDDVLVLSVAGDTQTEILAQRLVGELVHHAAPDVDLSIVNPLAAVVGWAIDDTLPGPRPQRPHHARGPCRPSARVSGWPITRWWVGSA